MRDTVTLPKTSFEISDADDGSIQLALNQAHGQGWIRHVPNHLFIEAMERYLAKRKSK